MKLAQARFVLRLPSKLHAQLRSKALVLGKSLNQLCISLLQQNLPGSGELGKDRELVLQTGVVPGLLLEAIQTFWTKELAGVLLFGSVARGEQNKASDIDLLIVLKKGAKISRELYKLWDDQCVVHCVNSPNVISPQFVTLPISPEEAGGLWLEAAMQGIVLLDKDLDLSRFLIELRSYILSGMVERKIAHGQPYWLRRQEAS